MKVFNSNFLYAMLSFRDNEVLLPTWCDVIVIYPLGVYQNGSEWVCDTPILTHFMGAFRVKPTKISQLNIYHPKRVFLTPDRVFWTIMRKNRSHQDPYMLPPRGVSTAHRIRTKFGRAGYLPNVTTHARFEINWYKIEVSFLALLRRAACDYVYILFSYGLVLRYVDVRHIIACT